MVMVTVTGAWSRVPAAEECVNVTVTWIVAEVGDPDATVPTEEIVPGVPAPSGSVTMTASPTAICDSCEVLTGIGPVAVRVPKVRSRTEEAAVFRSSLVPPYVRKARSVEALPWLYLRGISTGQMQQALSVLLGEEAVGLSTPVVNRLKTKWQAEHRAWCERRLADRWVYLWVDGIYSGVRAEDERLCALVVMGVNERGQ